jgi:orotate phosphoribosyltransferase
MDQNKIDFINLLKTSGALSIKPVRLTSGHSSNWMVNTGKFSTAKLIYELAGHYANTIVDNFSVGDYTKLFGPSYKGTFIVATTAMRLYEKYHGELCEDCGYGGPNIDFDMPFFSDRKEAKCHGEGTGQKMEFLGYGPEEGDKFLILDDVAAHLTTKRKWIEELGEENVAGIVFAVNREDEEDGVKCLEKFQDDFPDVRIAYIVDKTDIEEVLSVQLH